MKLLTPKYLPVYRKRLRANLASRWDASFTETGDQELRDFRTIESAVSSSQIEGSRVSIGEYTRSMLVSGGEPRERDIQEVHDLVKAYRTARRRKLTEANLLHVHGQLSETLLSGTNDRGVYRTKGIKVASFWETVYIGPDPTLVKGLMGELMGEVAELQQRTLSLKDAFYYAAMLHLRFVQIHPFRDGNGRTARLLEKWFLAEALGPGAWNVRSELYYRLNLDAYYRTLRMGKTWGEVDLAKSVPFLLQLPKAVMMPPKTGLIEHG